MLRRRAIVALIGLAGLVACASPNPALYTLTAVPGQAWGGGPRLIEMREIGLADYLDRPGIVRSADNYQLQLAKDDRWASPLAKMFSRVLGEDLSQRLPGSTVYSVSGAISARPDRVVEVNLHRFDADAGGDVVLAAEVAVRAAAGSRPRVAARSVRFSLRPRSAATADFVAALSTAAGRLADVIAEMLREG